MKNYINIVAGRSAVMANEEARFGDNQEIETINLIAMLYGDQSDTADMYGDRYKLLRSMVMGFLHAAGEDTDYRHKGTANLTIMTNHMGSNYRPSEHPDFSLMLEAAFDEVKFTRHTSTGRPIEYNRYSLKEDLSDVFIRFNEERKKAGLSEDAKNLFTGLE